jgi:hypothetical protein
MPKWEDIRDDLFEAVMQAQPAISKEQQAEIVRFMQARGHDMGWNAIRYVSQLNAVSVLAGFQQQSKCLSCQTGRQELLFFFSLLPDYFRLHPNSPSTSLFLAHLAPFTSCEHKLSSLTKLSQRIQDKQQAQEAEWAEDGFSKTGMPRRMRRCCWP